MDFPAEWTRNVPYAWINNGLYIVAVVGGPLRDGGLVDGRGDYLTFFYGACGNGSQVVYDWDETTLELKSVSCADWPNSELGYSPLIDAFFPVDKWPDMEVGSLTNDFPDISAGPDNRGDFWNKFVYSTPQWDLGYFDGFQWGGPITDDLSWLIVKPRTVGET